MKRGCRQYAAAAAAVSADYVMKWELASYTDNVGLLSIWTAWWRSERQEWMDYGLSSVRQMTTKNKRRQVYIR